MATLNPYINIYYGETAGQINAGEIDGILMSSNGELDSPLAAKLNATKQEFKIFKCAIRTEESYRTYGDTELSVIGPNSNKWTFAIDEDYGSIKSAEKNATFKDKLIIKDVISDKNMIFWVKLISDGNEKVAIDTSTLIHLKTTIEKFVTVG